MPYTFCNILSAGVHLHRINEEMNSVEDLSLCTGVVLVDLAVNGRVLEKQSIN